MFFERMSEITSISCLDKGMRMTRGFPSAAARPHTRGDESVTVQRQPCSKDSEACSLLRHILQVSMKLVSFQNCQTDECNKIGILLHSIIYTNRVAIRLSGSTPATALLNVSFHSIMLHSNDTYDIIMGRYPKLGCRRNAVAKEAENEQGSPDTLTSEN